jgi:hypothetical protein
MGRSLQYQSNPKHKSWMQPFDPDATLCPSWSHSLAQGLLDESLEHPSSGGRFATKNGMAFIARHTVGDIWHGYPLPWSAVPDAIREAMKTAGKVTTRQIKSLFSSEKLAKELDG